MGRGHFRELHILHRVSIKLISGIVVIDESAARPALLFHAAMDASQVPRVGSDGPVTVVLEQTFRLSYKVRREGGIFTSSIA